jgi:hypothetical protein
VVLKAPRAHVAGIVDQQVDAAEYLRGGGGDTVDGAVRGDVHSEDVGGTAGLADQLRRLAKRLFAAPHQQQMATAAAELERQLPADATARSGDHTASTTQIHSPSWKSRRSPAIQGPHSFEATGLE